MTPDNNPTPVCNTWKYCPRCGTSADAVGQTPFHCQNCQHRHHFGPVSAVAGIITDQAGRVLLLVRDRDPGRGLLGIPGGFCDPGETAEEALVREIREEVDLEATSMRYLGSFPNQYVYQKAILPVTDLFFTAEVRTTAGIRLQAGEVQSCFFCERDQIPLQDFAFESNRRAVQLFLQQS